MIHFIYFDVGGVVIKDFTVSNKWVEMQDDFGLNQTEREGLIKVWHRYQDEICVTRDVDSLMAILTKEVKIKFPKHYSLLEDMVNRFEANSSIWPIIKKVKTNTRIGLLTNMYPRMFALIQRKKIMPPVEWEVVIDSSVEGSQKPEARMFRIAYERSGIAHQQELLFVDNSQEHIEAAKTLGWQTYWYDSTNYEKSSKALLEYINKALTLKG
ncbi:hypothetical protein A2W24_01820 [Microgenomates group bacterium RBG_16_45_19]|nr:MAG: hypothetical protein A2W24_01820 [Microgenomates group bacterium RBG_16_45_19]